MAEDESNRPKVGIGVVICRDGKVLVGQRKNALGAGEHSLPGGHLEYKESFDECAIREVKEETGLDLKNCRKREVLSHVIHGKHYVTVYMSGEIDESAEPRTMEPDKCAGWFWADWDELPTPLFEPLKGLHDSDSISNNSDKGDIGILDSQNLDTNGSRHETWLLKR